MGSKEAETNLEQDIRAKVHEKFGEGFKPDELRHMLNRSSEVQITPPRPKAHHHTDGKTIKSLNHRLAVAYQDLSSIYHHISMINQTLRSDEPDLMMPDLVTESTGMIDISHECVDHLTQLLTHTEAILCHLETIIAE